MKGIIGKVYSLRDAVVGERMNEQKIALLTDTGTITPAEIIAAHDIRVAPLRIAF